jgi:hypothetical protein
MRVGVILLALWTVVNLVLTVRLASRNSDGVVTTTSTTTAASADRRTPIQLPIEARDAVLAEMRLMLGSVQGVINGVAQSDTSAIRIAAAASGMVMAADPALANVLPKAFMQYGMATHHAFDSLAANASAGPSAAVERLASPSLPTYLRHRPPGSLV